jgi:uncharacterized protein (TIGR03435 family)
MTFCRRLLSTLTAVATLAGIVGSAHWNAPCVSAQSPKTTLAPFPSFEIVSVKPSRPDDSRVRLGVTNDKFKTTNLTTDALIRFAYSLQSEGQLSGGPKWVNSEKYDIDAKWEDSLVNPLQKLPPDQLADQVRLMVQSLLADRFKLKVSHETRKIPVYVLIVAKNGPRLTPTTVSLPGSPGTPKPTFRGMRNTGRGKMEASGAPMSLLADALSNEPELGGRVVLDKTGLKGSYDFALQWTPEGSLPTSNSAGESSQAPGNATPSDSSGPSIFTAIQEQLGLKLQPRKAPMETVVIDYVETPFGELGGSCP